jgi:hypothetical protein
VNNYKSYFKIIWPVVMMGACFIYLGIAVKKLAGWHLKISTIHGQGPYPDPPYGNALPSFGNF